MPAPRSRPRKPRLAPASTKVAEPSQAPETDSKTAEEPLASPSPLPSPAATPQNRKAPRRRQPSGKTGPQPKPDDDSADADTGTTRPFEAGFAQWLQQAREQGLTPRELVWELHIAQGRSLPETARLLTLTTAEAAALHAEMRTLAVERAPREEADFIAVREELRVRLLAILEDACRTPGDARLLAVRQRVCDQLADLYGLKAQRRGTAAGEDTAPVAYSLPPELGEAVQGVVHSLYGRAADIAAARRHFSDQEEGDEPT